MQALRASRSRMTAKSTCLSSGAKNAGTLGGGSVRNFVGGLTRPEASPLLFGTGITTSDAPFVAGAEQACDYSMDVMVLAGSRASPAVGRATWHRFPRAPTNRTVTAQ